MKTVFFFATVLVAQAGFASPMTSDLSRQNDPEPQPILSRDDAPPIEHTWITIQEIEKEYAKAIPLNQAQLTGDWGIVFNKAVGVCRLASDWDGPDFRTNKDQTKPTFSFLTIKEEGLGVREHFVVSLLNQGHDLSDQGPYRVNPLEPQFSQFPYSDRGDLIRAAWLSYRCRGVELRQDMMVCKQRLNLKPGYEFVRENKICAKQDTAAWRVFRKF